MMSDVRHFHNTYTSLEGDHIVVIPRLGPEKMAGAAGSGSMEIQSLALCLV